MQNQLAHRQALRKTSVTALLVVQGGAGLLFTLFLLSQLLAPGRPIIVAGIAIFAGPAAGAALVVAIASFVLAWSVWRPRPWLRQRVMLLELFSLAIGAIELMEPGINRVIPLIRLLLAVLILLDVFVLSGQEDHPKRRVQ